MRFLEGLLMLCLLNGQSRQAYFVGIMGGMEQRWPSTVATRNDFKPNYNFGLAFEASKESLWGLGGEINYSTETTHYWNTSAGQAYKYDLSYVRAPLRIHLYMNKLSRTIRPKIGIGPCIGYLMGTGEHALDSELLQNQEEISRHFAKVDVGVQCMTGVNVRVSENLLMNLNLTCYNGFVDIDESHTKTQNRAVNIGFLLKVK